MCQQELIAQDCLTGKIQQGTGAIVGFRDQPHALEHLRSDLRGGVGVRLSQPSLTAEKGAERGIIGKPHIRSGPERGGLVERDLGRIVPALRPCLGTTHRGDREHQARDQESRKLWNHQCAPHGSGSLNSNGRLTGRGLVMGFEIGSSRTLDAVRPRLVPQNMPFVPVPVKCSRPHGMGFVRKFSGGCQAGRPWQAEGPARAAIPCPARTPRPGSRPEPGGTC